MKLFIPLLILMSLLITEAVAHNFGAPTGLTATFVGDRKVTLSWTPPSNTGSHPIQYYRYHVAEIHGNWNRPLHWSTESTDTTHTVTGLKRGETYTFLVRAVT